MEVVKDELRSCRLKNSGELLIPLFENRIPAGFPSPAMDYIEKRIDLNDEYIKHPLSTFIVFSEGVSMINAFIPNKARLIVDRSRTAQNGDIIIAVLDGEFTVKFLKKNPYKSWLCPANSKYPTIQITADMDFQIWGVVTTILIDTKDVRECMP